MMGRALLVGMFAATAAHAQPYDDPETEEALRSLDGAAEPVAPEAATTDATAPAPPQTLPAQPPAARAPGLALRRGKVVLTVTLEASLSKGSAFEPTSIAPDISYGATDRLTLSLVHSGFATTGFRGTAGGGVCVTGEDGGCAKVYNNVGAEALVDLVRGPLAVAGVAGVHALQLDPLFLDVKLGMQSTYRAGKIAATFFPSVLLGVTERDAGNKGGVFLPVSVGAQVAEPLFLAVGGGWAAPLADVGDAWTARLGVIARVRVAPKLFVAGSFFTPRIAGGDAVMATGFDTRTLNLWVTYAP